jgi:putative chitinase
VVISQELLQSVVPGVALGWSEPLSAAAREFGITTDLRIAAWLANILHETAGLTKLEEGFRYSRMRLLEVFSKYFTPYNVDDYLGHPRRIANRVYANRMGNGDEGSGDGWEFRGGGPAQLTGRANYGLCGAVLGVDLITHPRLVSSNALIGARSAGWFWSHNKLSQPADDGDFLTVCQRWNGSRKPWGMAERQEHYDNLIGALATA